MKLATVIVGGPGLADWATSLESLAPALQTEDRVIVVDAGSDTAGVVAAEEAASQTQAELLLFGAALPDGLAIPAAFAVARLAVDARTGILVMAAGDRVIPSVLSAARMALAAGADLAFADALFGPGADPRSVLVRGDLAARAPLPTDGVPFAGARWRLRLAIYAEQPAMIGRTLGLAAAPWDSTTQPAAAFAAHTAMIAEIAGIAGGPRAAAVADMALHWLLDQMVTAIPALDTGAAWGWAGAGATHFATLPPALLAALPATTFAAAIAQALQRGEIAATAAMIGLARIEARLAAAETALAAQGNTIGVTANRVEALAMIAAGTAARNLASQRNSPQTRPTNPPPGIAGAPCDLVGGNS